MNNYYGNTKFAGLDFSTRRLLGQIVIINRDWLRGEVEKCHLQKSGRACCH